MEGNRETYVTIAFLGCNETAAIERINKMMSENGIKFDMGGSLVYGIMVRTADVDKATALLKADSAPNEYGIKFGSVP
jgi:hypothetical protein